MISTGSMAQAVHEFAASVREALSDLPDDDIDELTDGLEADLSERAAELGGTDAFGDPVVYADELRVSAGLPERGRGPVRRRRGSGDLARAWKTFLGRASRGIRSSPAGAWLLDLLVALRPVWWVVRGWTVFQVLCFIDGSRSWGVIPLAPDLGGTGRLVAWVILLACVLLSVQWGRGRWLPWAWLRVVLVVASIGAVLAVLPATTIAIGATEQSYGSAYSEPAQQLGLSQDGNEIYNVYAYDADGKPLQNVRLYDQDGNPLVTNPDPGDAGAPTLDGTSESGQLFHLAPNPLADGMGGWSVYPLTPTDRTALPAPFVQVQPLKESQEMTPVPSSGPPAPPPGSPSSPAQTSPSPGAGQ